ncbi:Palmitoyltransferase [Rhizophlyctis rosea]|nr:Palmitoyltransferase [Rhizophlyctis rosea]
MGPWLNTCIGHYNIGHFLRFIWSVTFASFTCLTLIAFRIRDVARYQYQFNDPSSFLSHSANHFYTPLPDTPEVITMIVNLVILFFLLLSVGILAVWQLYYATKNVTTIESFENNRIYDLVKKKKIPTGLVYPYDLGLVENIKSVLGRRIWAWWIPQRSEGDGIHFKVSDEAERAAKEKGVSIDWPPKAYYVYKREGNRSERGGGGSSTKHAKNEDVHGAAPLLGRRGHVRRGSEGYVVREWTEEERNMMVQMAHARAEAEAAGNPPNGSLLARPKPLIQLDIPPPDLSAKDSEGEEEEDEGSNFDDDESSDDEWSEEEDDDTQGGEDADVDGRVGVDALSDDDVPLASVGIRQRIPNDYVDDGGVATSCSGDVKHVANE